VFFSVSVLFPASLLQPVFQRKRSFAGSLHLLGIGGAACDDQVFVDTFDEELVEYLSGCVLLVHLASFLRLAQQPVTK
jgi:hypothetical protein